jgi:hypothetical protein
MNNNRLPMFALVAAVVVLGGCGEDKVGPGIDCPACDIPASHEGVFTFLMSRQYLSWDKEGTVHVSLGPHRQVLTYLSPKLSTSLAGGARVHPLGAAVVKEIYAGDHTTLDGWSAWIKTASDSGAGANIFWYENFSTTDNSDPITSKLGDEFCANCHSGSANDFLQTTYPLAQ